MLRDECFLAKKGVDTAENGPNLAKHLTRCGQNVAEMWPKCIEIMWITKKMFVKNVNNQREKSQTFRWLYCLTNCVNAHPEFVEQVEEAVRAGSDQERLDGDVVLPALLLELLHRGVVLALAWAGNILDRVPTRPWKSAPILTVKNENSPRNL